MSKLDLLHDFDRRDYIINGENILLLKYGYSFVD